MLGATLIALFGVEGDPKQWDIAREVLHRIYPETKRLSDEDQWGFELVKGSRVAFLQWQISKLEAHRDAADPQHGRRILKALGGL
jgi:hypothetical protein